MGYKFIKHRGQGGFGLVDVVENDLGQPFAKKTYRLSPFFAGDASLEETSKKRFIKEAKYQKQISHRNIVPVLEIYLKEEPPYVIMPLAEASLNDDIQSGLINKANYMNAISDIMAGLEEIHNLGIYHRDLKPSNVLRFCAEDGGRDFYAISDFGLMSMKETSVTTLTATGSTRNSDFYTAPEITINLSAASVQSDIYSLGCLLHDFVGLNPARVPCGEIHDSSEFGSILFGCTRTDPKRRFKDISSLRDALASIDVKDIKATSAAGEQIVDLLNDAETVWNETTIQQVIHFLITNNADKETILKKITLDHIKKMAPYDLQFRQVALQYADWLRNSSFDFAFCDTIANRMMEFIETSEVDVQSEGLMALLYLGTNHNRFYVERKLFNYMVTDASENVIKRLAVEIRIDGEKAVSAFAHLEHSISANLGTLPNIIIKAIDESTK